MKYFDAHCHVQFDPYDVDRGELLARMKDELVGGVVVGVDADSSEKAIALVEAYSNLYASVGLHPNYETQETFDANRALTLARNPKVVAIGECGLDYYRVPRGFGEGQPSENPKQTKGASSAYYRPEEVNDAVKRAQKILLEKQIEVAVTAEKPLIIHARPSKGTMDAYKDLIDLLSSKKNEYGDRLRGDIHFFVGGVEEAKVLFALDFTVSYTAVLTFTHDYDEVVRYAPLSHLLSETDSPYVAPAGSRGKRNSPLAVVEVVRTMAAIRGEEEALVQEALVQNAKRLFQI